MCGGVCGGGGSDDILCGGDCSDPGGDDDGVVEFEESISVADSDGFSFSAEKYNAETYNIFNVEVSVTVNLNDFEGNPPPDGTFVLFDTEAGTIDGSCTVVAGGCSVTWRSGNPRPVNGRFIIFARALGAESFTDLDNDDLFGGSCNKWIKCFFNSSILKKT